MKPAILKRIIVSQQEEIEDKFKKTKIIPRAIDLKKIQSYLNIPNILAIAGIRRCGKSVLSWQIAQENKPFAYINFGCRHSEDPDEAPISSGRISFDLTARSFIPTLSGFRMKLSPAVTAGLIRNLLFTIMPPLTGLLHH